ncbi:DUF6085 family protein [Streptomyces sp. NBC_01383]|uniref:DUF6085 family protein n=1 Tax=Streptomyces sp. NBC_01383 TaxID=2903846 RepID=UPI0032527B86
MTDVQGRCPACGGASLFLGEGGHVTCSHIDCPAPDTADMLLCGGETALVQALGGDRKARVVAHTLHFHGCSIFDVRRMTDEQFFAVPGIAETSLARIRAAFPAPEPAPDVLVLDALKLIFTRWRNAGHVPTAEALLDLVETVRAVAPAIHRGQEASCPCHGGHELCSGCHRCPNICSGCDGPGRPISGVGGAALIGLDVHRGFADGIAGDAS